VNGTDWILKSLMVLSRLHSSPRRLDHLLLFTGAASRQAAGDNAELNGWSVYKWKKVHQLTFQNKIQQHTLA